MTRINVLAGALELSTEDPEFQDFLEEPEDIGKLQTADEFREELLKRMFEQPKIIGPSMRLSKLEDRLRFPGGQVSINFGFNGHGKSLIESQVAIDMAMLDEPVVIASFEMAPMATLHRMVKQTAGTGEPTRDWVEAFLVWAQGRVWIYNHRGQANPDKLIAIVRYAAARKGIKHVFVDSLMKVVRGVDDYQGQKDFVDASCRIALELGIHVHIVHHVRKGMDEYSVPGKMDAKGGGEIMDQVDTAYSTWRNLRLEEKRRAGQLTEADSKSFDAIVSIVKSRHIEEAEGKVGLFYNVGAQSYSEVCGRALRYPLDAYLPDREIAL